MNGVILRKKTDINPMDMSKTFQQIKTYALLKGLPMIPVQADNISLIKSPDEFYRLMLQKIDSARDRITLSSLYLGSGPKERALVREIHQNIKRNPSLNVNVILDANRAERLDVNGRSSLTILHDVMTYDQFNLQLVTTHKRYGFARILLEKFKKLNELYSTYHSKALIFDEDVILTGANLSDIYFDKRQDRYMYIRKSKLLSDYIARLMVKIEQPDRLFKDQLRSYNQNFIINMEEFDKSDCLVIPVFQHKGSGLNDCDDFINFLNRIMPETAHISMSSGYFNPYLDLRLNTVLVPCERANGFYRGSGLLKYVPMLYSAILNKFAQKHPNCEYQLYNRPGWSFHAKGMWVDNLDIHIHMIGSSNLNWRSSVRDFETQFFIVTSNSSLIRKIEEEREYLWRQSEPLSERRVNTFIYEAVSWLIKSSL